jgi:type III restriction enzyme
MDDRFFKQPILNNPYEYPSRHWELDEQGQPTQPILEFRRSAQFITPIPKPKKRRGSARQIEMVLDEGEGLSDDDQQYDLTSTINSFRNFVSDLEEVYNTERHLLYVACTRAHDHLLVTGVEPVSEFLDDLMM